MECGKLHKAGIGTVTISSFHFDPGKFKLPGSSAKSLKQIRSFLCPTFVIHLFISKKGASLRQQHLFFRYCVESLYLILRKCVPIISVAAS